MEKTSMMIIFISCMLQNYNGGSKIIQNVATAPTKQVTPREPQMPHYPLTFPPDQVIFCQKICCQSKLCFISLLFLL